MLEIFCVVTFVAVALCLSSIKFLKDYERLVIFQLGRVTDVRGPGPQIVWPFVENYKKVDLRVVTMPVTVQEVVTRDNVSVGISAVCYYQISDPRKAIGHVDDFRDATIHVVQSVLQDVLRGYESTELTTLNKRVVKTLVAEIEPKTTTWGIRISEIVLTVGAAQAGVEQHSQTVNFAPTGPATHSEKVIQAGTAVVQVESKTSASSTPTSIAAPTVSTPVSGTHTNSHEIIYALPDSHGVVHHDAPHHKFEHQSYHRKHKHTHFSFDHDAYDFGNHSYQFGHDHKSDHKSEHKIEHTSENTPEKE